jgi:orotidine-5'-phosphate decarboxylase
MTSPAALHKLQEMTQVETVTGVFADRVVECVDRKRSQLVLGLDPVLDLLPVELQGEARGDAAASADAVARFCRGLIDAAAPVCIGVKPQLAFFEALGSHGMRAFEDACAYAREAGLLVIADAKRGDIGSTARAYAAAYVEPRSDGAPVADAITVNAYLGRESVEPFLAACKRHGSGLFIVTKTSNAGSADVQDLRLRDGDIVWHRVAMLAREWGEELLGERGLSSVGLVIGATYPRAVGEARRLCPQQVLLLPGIGAQGAGPAEVARAFTSGPASALVSVSRAIDYAYRARGGDWRTAAGAEAARLRDEIWAVSGW